jgi:hypothetical protein
MITLLNALKETNVVLDEMAIDCEGHDRDPGAG